MGRCGGWIKGLALLVVALIVGCGDTDNNKPASTGKPFVFQARGRLNLAVQVDPTDPKLLYLTATLLDPQGNPMRNQRVTFEAEFPETVFLPLNAQNDPLACLDRAGIGNTTRCVNRGAAITDDNGQAKVTLFSIVGSNTAPRNPGRLMRVTAEAPNSLDIATSVSVPFTNLGFLIGGALSIIPPQVTFVNPLVRPGTDGPKVTFSAQGGKPPYRWENQNKDLGRITIKGQQNINELIEYTLIGPIKTGTAEAITDTITLNDVQGSPVATATVNAIFADCDLKLTESGHKFKAPVGGERFDVHVVDGVPPFTVTEGLPGMLAAGFPQTSCLEGEKNCTLRFALSTPPFSLDTEPLTIRDSRGCVAVFNVSTDLCGNGDLDGANEECDGADSLTALGLTCSSLNGKAQIGSLRCSTDCKIDSSKCADPPTPTAPTCGNGALNAGELCDGTNFGGVTCADILRNGTAVGTLRCSADCKTIDSGFCRIPPP